MNTKNGGNPKEKTWLNKIYPQFRAGWLFLVIALLIICTCSTGCISKIMKVSDAGSTGTPEATPAVAGNTTVVTPSITQLIVQMTPMKSDVVTEVTPYTTPNPYPIIHGVRINGTPQYNFLTRAPEFTKTYTLGGNAVGLLVNVVQGPLYIVYTIDPKYDCLKDPDSCRGTSLVPVNRPYMTITVRDNQTHEIIAEDGYAREYSSDIGHYSITIINNDPSDTSNGESETSTSEPGPRYIPIYREGQFQVTIDGNYLDVTVKIITGASPDILTAQEKLTTAPTPASDSDNWN